MNNSHWYAVRVVPGSQRVARRTEEQDSRRRLETIVEREFRNEGIEGYMPSFWTTVRHQRTNKMIDKRFPLLVGYAFVNIQPRQFEEVRALNNVVGFLRTPRGGPVAFRDDEIGGLMLSDHARRTEFEQTRAEREERAKENRRGALNRQLGLILPKGRNKKRRESLRVHAQAEIEKLPLAARERVLCILRELDSLASATACSMEADAVCSAA